jgi:hypothetical protein
MTASFIASSIAIDQWMARRRLQYKIVVNHERNASILFLLLYVDYMRNGMHCNPESTRPFRTKILPVLSPTLLPVGSAEQNHPTMAAFQAEGDPPFDCNTMELPLIWRNTWLSKTETPTTKTTHVPIILQHGTKPAVEKHVQPQRSNDHRQSQDDHANQRQPTPSLDLSNRVTNALASRYPSTVNAEVLGSNNEPDELYDYKKALQEITAASIRMEIRWPTMQLMLDKQSHHFATNTAKPHACPQKEPTKTIPTTAPATHQQAHHDGKNADADDNTNDNDRTRSPIPAHPNTILPCTSRPNLDKPKPRQQTTILFNVDRQP